MINRVILIGRVGSDPDTRQVNNNSVCNLTLATSETYKDKSGEKQQKTEWHNLQIWGKLSEIVEKYVKKGQLVYVEGKITTQSWEKDGTKHYKTVIVVSSLQMLGCKPEEKTTTTYGMSQDHEPEQIEDNSDLPY
jgi:single-strand DNA-binding protein